MLGIYISDYLERLEDDAQETANIWDIIRNSHFDKGFTSRWKPVRFQLIKNKHLDQEYEGRHRLSNVTITGNVLMTN